MPQYLSLWLSVIATLISISSFLLNFKNSKRSQKLEALQRRTQLLARLNEAKINIQSLGIEFKKMEWAMLELKTSLPLNEELKRFFARIESDSQSSQNQIIDNIREIDEIHNNLTLVTTAADAWEIEKILPRVDNVISQLAIVFSNLNATMSYIESCKKELQSSPLDSEDAT